MKVALVSHAFLEEEHLKNVAALGAQPEITAALAVVPKRGSVTLRKNARALTRSDVLQLLAWQHRGQLAFWPPTLGLSHFRPDLIHVDYPPWSIPFWQATIAAHRLAPSAALVCTIKKNTYRDYGGPLGRLKSRIARTGFRYVDGVEFSSEMARQSILTHFPSVNRAPNSVLTHQGVDVTHFTPREGNGTRDGAFLVGYAGRIDKRDKALDLVIRALEECRARVRADIRFDILGGGPDSGSLGADVKDKPWVRVLPPVAMSAVPAFLRTLDLFVLPSRVRPDHEEHDAQALLQAAACGLPTIATASGINSEIVRKGVGVVVPANDLSAMIDVVGAFVLDSTLRIETSRRARQAAVKYFAVKTVARERLSLYKRVLVMRGRKNAD